MRKYVVHKALPGALHTVLLTAEEIDVLVRAVKEREVTLGMRQTHPN